MALTDSEREQLAALTAKAAEPDEAPAAAEVAAEVGAQTVETIGAVAQTIANVVQDAERTASARVEQAHDEAAREVAEATELADLALGVATVVAEQAEALELAAEVAVIAPADDTPALELVAGESAGASSDVTALSESDPPKVDPQPDDSTSSGPRGHWYFRKRGKRT